MKALVTGSSGFIGSHLVEELSKQGFIVYGVDDRSSGKKENEFCQTIEGDCRDYEFISMAMSVVQPDVVFHLAANAAESKGQFSPIDITSRGYDASIKVLTASIKHKVKKFVFVSSAAVYGSATPLIEDITPQPEDLYGLGKYSTEESIKILSKVHDFKYTILRLHNVYGPRQNMSDPYRNVIMIWINKILRKEPYVLFNGGSNQRCYSYVKDVVRGIVIASINPNGVNQTFNLGSDRGTTLNELSDLILKTSGTDILPEYLPSRPQEIVNTLPDHNKIRDILGVVCDTTLEEGIKKTWEFAKEQGPQEFKYTEIELPSEKMPKNWKP